MHVGISSGVETGKMDKLLRKLGFEFTGGNYAIALS